MADISKVKLPDNVTYNLKDSGAVRKTGDTMTDDLILYKEGTTTNNHPSSLIFSNKDTTTGQTYSNAYIKVYQDHGSTTYGTNMVIHTGGGLFLGSGESPASHYSAKGASYSGEDTFLTADGTTHLQANGNTIANRVGVQITTGHALVPEKADVATNNIGSIGTSSYKWANGYFTNINGVAVGDSPKFTDTTYTFTNKNATLAWSTTSTIATVGGVDIKVTMPANPNTNTDTLVTQTNTTTNADYRVLFSENANDTTETKTARKSTNLKYNPSTGNLQTTQLNGVAVGSSPKFTDTNTHRPIQMNGTEILGNNTTALNLVAGTNVSLSNDGGAVTITATDTNNAVAITNTNPTTGTWYYPVWHSSTSATSTGLKANDGFRHYSLQGTTSAAGRTILSLGNGTATGAAGNKYGEIRIYSQKQGYSTLTMASRATAERKHTLPDVAGTIGVFTATPTSGQVVVSDGTAGGFKTTGYTIAKSVPSNAVFTDSSGNNRVLRAGDNMTGSLTTTGSFIADTQVGAPTIAASSNLYAGDFCKITSSGTTGTNGSAYIRAINDESGTTHTLIKIGNGSISCENSAGTPVSLTASAIELSHATPLIDFHHNSSTQDFTSRIITTNLAELTFYGKNSSGTTVYGTCRGAAFTVVSSKYMKENIKDIEDDEAMKLLQLRPVSFDYKYTGETNKRGLIAEEVLDVMPEMVYVPEDYSEPVNDEIPDNVPSIDYSKFVPYLIKMVQIQQKEIDQLKARI